MEDKIKHIVKYIEDCDVQDVIEFFGSEAILQEMNEGDIADCLNWSILSRVPDEDLIEAIADIDNVLDNVDNDDIVEYLESKGYHVTTSYDNMEENLKNLKVFCRQLQPTGFIGKEEAKKLLCEYIDNWMIKCF